MRWSLRATLGGVALAVLALAAPPARASDQSEVLRLRGESLAREGHCLEALPVLERASAADPSDGRPLVLMGQCQIQLKRYPDAVASLEAAKKLAAPPPDTDLYLGIARFHLGDQAGAERALSDARSRTPDRAEIDLYQGILLLQKGQSREAAEMLERAREKDAAAVEPLASYYAGLAWAAVREDERARRDLGRVQDVAPGSPWSTAADRALRQLQHAGGDRSWVQLSAGIEWDSNVVLQGTGVQLPTEISNSRDWRGVWTLEGGTELYRDADWTVGLLASYYGSAHFNLNEFDVEYPSIGGWVDRKLGESTTARLQYDFGYAWVGYAPFVLQHTVTPALFQDWGELGTTRLYSALSWSNYFFGSRAQDVPDGPPGGGPGSLCPGTPTPADCGPFGLNERAAQNRDGFGLTAGVEHWLPIEAIHTVLRGGYAWTSYASRGSEYSYGGHQLELGARTQLPFEFVVDLQGTYGYLPYRHPSTFPDPRDLTGSGVEYPLSGVRRRENAYAVDAVLERKLTEWLTASVRYAYVRNRSNVAVYDYDFHLVGAYLTVRFHQ